MSKPDPASDREVFEIDVETAISMRLELLRRFSEDPDNDDVWVQAYEWARAEGDSGVEGIAASIPVEDLSAFAQRVRSEDDSQRRYALTLEESPDGRNWFDALETFHSPSNAAIKDEVLAWLVTDWRAGEAFPEALDLGVGTGRSLWPIEKHVARVIGVDRSQELLWEAEKRIGSSTELRAADVTKLPFEGASFDLITSEGLLVSLGSDNTIRMFSEVKRLLAPGGFYLDTGYAPNAYDEPHPELVRVTRTAKGVLADMIVDTVSGRCKVDRLSTQDRLRLFEDIGLTEDIWIHGPDEGPRAYVRMIRHVEDTPSS